MQLHNGAFYSPIPFACSGTCNIGGEKKNSFGGGVSSKHTGFCFFKTHGPICTRQMFMFFVNFVVKNDNLQV